MATATEGEMEVLSADPLMLQSMVDAVESCLQMCGVEAKCVAVSTVPPHDIGCVTGMIGVHGDVSGFATVNMAEKVATSAVSGLLQEKYESLCPQVIDGVGEMTNIIVGGIKKGLSTSKWCFSQVTVPSVIIGHNYQIAYAGGLNFLSATFEHKSEESFMLEDRLIQVSLSLIQL
jgi:chemotaxis protein CheX